MIISREVTTKWCGANKKYYIERGYLFTKMGEEFTVKVEDLPMKSSIDVKVQCDYCGKIKMVRYSSYTQNYCFNLYGKFGCNKCTQHFIKSYTIDEIRTYIEKYGYKLIDDCNYRTMHDKVIIQCDKGHIYKTEFNVFKQGCRCPMCDAERWLKDGNPNYKIDLTDEEREKNKSRHSDLEYRKWYKSVFKRDNYTCQCCEKHGGLLNAHHLNGYEWDTENRLNINNGITLCESCHKEFHSLYGYGNNTIEQYKEFIKNKNQKSAS